VGTETQGEATCDMLCNSQVCLLQRHHCTTTHTQVTMLCQTAGTHGIRKMHSHERFGMPVYAWRAAAAAKTRRTCKLAHTCDMQVTPHILDASTMNQMRHHIRATFQYIFQLLVLHALFALGQHIKCHINTQMSTVTSTPTRQLSHQHPHVNCHMSTVTSTPSRVSRAKHSKKDHEPRPEQWT